MALPGQETVTRRRKQRVTIPTDPGRAESALTALVAIAVVGSVLCVGAVHLPVLVGLSAVSVGAGILGWTMSSRPWPFPAWIALGLAGFTLLQTVPMPMGLLARIAPNNADVWAHALAPLGEAPLPWAPLSLDPGASLVVALKWVSYALLFVAASALGERRGNRRGITIVFAAAVLAAVVTVMHGLLGAHKVFGLYQPEFQPAPWHLGPLLNPNNLAGYLNLGAVCGLGLLVAKRPTVPRWLIGAGVATLVAVEVTSASRAGMVALPLGVLLFGLVLSPRQRRHEERGSRWAARGLILGALAGGAVLGLLAATTSTWRELWDKNMEKLDLLRWVEPMVRAHPWFGIGPGAFETTFPEYRATPGNIAYRHAENFVADWSVSWGLPATLLALCAFAWAFRRSALGARRSSVAAAGWAGAVALFAQNLVDLGLEIPGIVVAATVVLGTLWGANAGHRRDTEEVAGRASWRPWHAWSVAMGVALLAVASLRWGWRDATTERRELHARLEALGTEAASRADFRRDLRGVMLRHPAEPYFPLLGAVVAWRFRDLDPIPWLSRALDRDMTNARAHLLLAEVLASRRALGQALLELRLAVEADATLTPNAAQRAVSWTQDCDLLAQAAPSGAPGGTMLAVLGASLGTAPDRSSCQLRLVREGVARSPREAHPRQVLATILLDHLARGGDGGVCSDALRSECERDVEVIGKALEAEMPTSAVGTMIRGRLLRIQRQPARAASLLAERCPDVRDKPECLRARLDAAGEAQPAADLQVAIQEYLAVRCSAASACAEANTHVANLLAARRDFATAVTYFERATHDEPTEGRWLALADASQKSGEHARALSALEKVARLRGQADGALQARIDDARRKVMGL